MTWFEEKLYDHWRQTFKISRTLFHEKTGHQDLIIFETPGFGRVLALDGVIQVTEGDEYVYHEMMAHVPILAHGEARTVCIVGGGDGGVLREVLKHPGVERAVMVEIDAGVIDMCRKYMPKISAGAFDHPRAEIVIADGIRFMAETDRRFDVIIVDSTDPIGPGEVLFTEQFYKDCAARLTPAGIVINQNGVPVLQGDEVPLTLRRRRPHFADAGFIVAAVPTYVGGFMALGWASHDPAARAVPVDEIRRRYRAAGAFPTRYYNPDMHVGSFALPQFIHELMAEA